MGSYGVLVVDDSAFMRKSISQIIDHNPNFQVVGIARNGIDAIEKVKRLQPDVVTMDVEMPEMDGLAAVEQIMRVCPVPVVMVSSLTHTGTNTTIRALQLGAVDCVHKEQLLNRLPVPSYDDFFARLEAAATARVTPSAASAPQTAASQVKLKTSDVSKVGPVELILIGCSTGGPAALQAILPRLPADLNAPVVVIQHMPVGFTKSLAERFDSICQVRVKEVEDGDVLQRGWVYIAPAGVHTLLTRTGRTVAAQLSGFTAVETRFRPSVDVTLLSAAPIYGQRLFTIILTGMGNDGTLGCQEVKRHGGYVMVQSEESCVVYGMPKSVVEAGCADLQVPLESIGEHVQRVALGR